MVTLITLCLTLGSLQEVREHADAILARQLGDGAIIHIEQGDEIIIVPYFGNYSALGLFEAYRATGDDRYLRAAVDWTDWYLTHVEPDGKISDYRGSRTSYHSTGECDSTDAYAATFLVCADVRRTLTGDKRFVLRERGKLWNVYHQMLATADVDGLTYAKPGYPYKLTMDNAEVFLALEHAKRIAESIPDWSWSRDIFYARRKLTAAFERMRNTDGQYPWVVTKEKTAGTDLSNEFYPTGLANVMAAAIGPVGWHDAKTTLRRTYEQFPDFAACKPDHLYWWFVAARRVHRNDIAQAALVQLHAGADARGLAVDHAHLIRAITSFEGLRPAPQRPGKPYPSTFIEIPPSSS